MILRDEISEKQNRFAALGKTDIAATYFNCIQCIDKLLPKERGVERFKKPTDKQRVELAILFNDGVLDQHKLTDMVAYAEFIIDRLYENGDITQPSEKEK